MNCKALLLTTALLSGLSGFTAPKVIDLSWSNPTVDFLEKNIQKMNQTAPVDGLTIRVRGKQVKWKEKNLFAFQYLWSGCPLEYSHFEEEVARLKKIPFGRFTDNFWYSTTYNYNTDWFNDAEWKTVAANFGVAARAAREAGLKGFLFDIEEYGKKFWDYNKLNTKMSLEETRKIVYRRGQQWGKAVFAAYPDITIFMPFMLTMGQLSVPFVNGIMSVMPPQARMIEGSEWMGYACAVPDDFLLQHRMYYKAADNATVVYPENRTKYLTQTSLAPSLYMDAYLTLSRYGQKEQIDREGVVRVFRRNLAAASFEGSQYVWLYGEKGSWWNGSEQLHRQIRKTWEQQAPGITDAAREVMNRDTRKLSAANLLENGNFKDTSGWYVWQMEQDRKLPLPGTILVGDGKAVLKKNTNGSVSQRFNLKPGEYYGVLFSGINRSTGDGGCELAFRASDGRWLSSERNFKLPLPQTGKEETVFFQFKVRDDAANVIFTLYARNQGKDDSDEIIFTGAQLLKF